MVSGPSQALQSNVLILNRLYLAIHVVSVRRAFCLLWKGMAEVVNIEDDNYITYDFESWREISELKETLGERGENDDWILAINFSIQVPRVIRLLNYDRIPRNTVTFSRRNVFLRDGNLCQYCSKRFSIGHLSIDHVIPRSRGGKTTWENVVSACLKCNVRKGGRTPKEAGMKLPCRPSQPKRNPLFSYQLNSSKYACWKKFIR